MILVATSIWIDHLRTGNSELAAALDRTDVLTHPCVIGELVLGGLRDPDATAGLLAALPQAIEAEHSEVRALINRERLAATGIGYVDAQLLASVLLTSSAVLWTRDKKLRSAAERLGIAHQR